MMTKRLMEQDKRVERLLGGQIDTGSTPVRSTKEKISKKNKSYDDCKKSWWKKLF